ncbi:MAG: hypothetical protein IT290_04025 [Deltaproteobacteria bacterium]|nr:hypothetical protein [Deltaproteobacteria bacterium]
MNEPTPNDVDAVAETMHALHALAFGRICPNRLKEAAHNATDLGKRLNSTTDDTISRLCPRSEVLLFDLNPANRSDVLRKYEDLSLRVIAVALTVGNHDPKFFEQMFTHIPNNDRPIIEYQDGLSVSWLCRSAVILLPEISTPAESSAILNSLNRLYVESPHEANWIIDMSAVRTPNLAFLGALAGLQNEFLTQSRRISLVWLNESILSSRPLRTTFTDIFRLKQIGQHFFSIYP